MRHAVAPRKPTRRKKTEAALAQSPGGGLLEEGPPTPGQSKSPLWWKYKHTAGKQEPAWRPGLKTKPTASITATATTAALTHRNIGELLRGRKNKEGKKTKVVGQSLIALRQNGSADAVDGDKHSPTSGAFGTCLQSCRLASDGFCTDLRCCLPRVSCLF